MSTQIKKFIALSFVLFLIILAFSSCGKSESESTEADNSNDSVIATTALTTTESQNKISDKLTSIVGVDENTIEGNAAIGFASRQLEPFNIEYGALSHTAIEAADGGERYMLTKVAEEGGLFQVFFSVRNDGSVYDITEKKLS